MISLESLIHDAAIGPLTAYLDLRDWLRLSMTNEQARWLGNMTQVGVIASTQGYYLDGDDVDSDGLFAELPRSSLMPSTCT